MRRLFWALSVVAYIWPMSVSADVRLIIPAEPGGNYDTLGRIIAQHLRAIPQNMPGAGGVIAANYLANVAPQDGSVIGMVHAAAIQAQALGERGVRFDANKFFWLGSPTRFTSVLVAWNTVGIRTLDDLRTRSVVMGVSTVRNAAYGQLLNVYQDTHIKIVRGYRSIGEIALAMARGEVDVMTGFTWDEWTALHPDWVRERRVVPVVDLGSLAQPGKSGPFEFMANIDGLGRPLAVPSSTSGRVDYRQMVSSREFQDQLKQIGATYDPTTGANMAKMVSDVLSTPKNTIEQMNRLLQQ